MTQCAKLLSHEGLTADGQGSKRLVNMAAGGVKESVFSSIHS